MVDPILSCDSQGNPPKFLVDFLFRKVLEGPLYIISFPAAVDVIWGANLLVNLGKPAGRLRPPKPLHANCQARTLARMMATMTRTLALGCFTRRLLPIFNTKPAQHQHFCNWDMQVNSTLWDQDFLVRMLRERVVSCLHLQSSLSFYYIEGILGTVFH